MVDVMSELIDEHITAKDALAVFEELANLGAPAPGRELANEDGA